MNTDSPSVVAEQVEPDFSPISGSYSPEDCLFLLQPIETQLLSVEEKEARLQKGGQHYSEMVSQENPPSSVYVDLFFSLVKKYQHQLAVELASLAKKMVAERGQEITLLSLARAGTPIGVLLKRAIQHFFPQVSVTHYAISIVRDFGLDESAIAYVLNQGHSPESIIFVDGWTAKGVISKELKAAVNHWNSHHEAQIPDTLCVVSDIGGSADLAATTNDYAMPWGILNSTVSGLISRSIRPANHRGVHQCVEYTHLKDHDLSNWFIEAISGEFLKVSTIPDLSVQGQAEKQAVLTTYIQDLQLRYKIEDINKIKPGIAEATRVMLRRIPRLLLVKQISSDDVQHLMTLAAEKGVEVLEDASMPFQAVALIAQLD